MSHTLLTADNISVKGHHYKAESYESLSATPENTKIEDAIHLDFTLLINGKLKTFGWSFIIEKPENSTQPFELASWSDWNAISFILSSLGYRINEN